MIVIITLCLVLGVMVGILGTIIYIIFGGFIGESIDGLKDAIMHSSDKSLADMKNFIICRRAEGEEYRARLNEELKQRELDKMEEVKKNNNKGTPGNIRMSHGNSPLVNSGNEYIPYNLSEKDKELLKLFNSEA